jgi:hypothetical protein
MNRAVYKYRLTLGDQTLDLPVAAEIIKVGVELEDGSPQLALWAVVQTKSENVISHKIIVAGTGHPLPDDSVLEHLDTVQHNSYVWHIFKVLLP